VATKAAKELYASVVVKNDSHKGLRIWKKILPLVHLWTYQQIGPVSDLAIYRSILNSWGLHGGVCRDPFFPLDQGQEEKLRHLLEVSGWNDPDHVLDSVR
jgi:dihydrodipicolinate synthase/N-acetylneuraminate lyase